MHQAFFHAEWPLAANELAHHLQCATTACAEFAEQHARSRDPEQADQLRRIELKAILHFVQARQCARETSALDGRLADCVELFLKGTDPLEQAAAIRCDALLLGGRITVVTALQLAQLMLEACRGIYLRELAPSGSNHPALAGQASVAA